MKAKEYVIFSEAVETGINTGWNRAFKHLDIPEEVKKFLDTHEHIIKENIYNSVTGEVCEYFIFEHDIEQW
jgi:hypothetical protein